MKLNQIIRNESETQEQFRARSWCNAWGKCFVYHSSKGLHDVDTMPDETIDISEWRARLQDLPTEEEINGGERHGKN